MAFPHHDPRYAQSPYHFQAPFAPPQQHNPAFGLGPPNGPPLAPPQAYLLNRNQHQYPPVPPVAGQPGFPGAFPNVGQYQHNAQYNPSMAAGPGPMAYQAPQQMPAPFYNTRPFQGGPPPPPGQMAAMHAPSPTNAVPPPPPPALQQQSSNNGSRQWAANPNLPPKPPTVGYRESVELHSRQNSAQIPQPSLPGLGVTQPSSEHTGVPTGSMHLEGSSRQEHLDARYQHPVNTRIHEDKKTRPESTNMYNPDHQINGRTDVYSAASHTTLDDSRAPNGTVGRTTRVDESPDMYSPQLHPQHLPGLGVPNEQFAATQNRNGLGGPDTSGLHAVEGHYSPPADLPSSMMSGPTPAAKPSHAAVVVPAIDPFTIKEKASQALRELYTNDIGFLDIAGNGIHPNVLRNLCIELGLELDSTKPKPKPKPKLKEPPKATATKKSQVSVQSKPATAPPKKPVAQAPTKPLSREEYLAKLRAAKGDKASTPENSDQPATAAKSHEVPQPAETTTDTTAPATPENGASSPKPQVKKHDPKSKEQNALIRQRLEALKKSTLEKQKKQAEDAAHAASQAAPKPIQIPRVIASQQAKSNGEYTPANPFFASTGSFQGLPGLSMFDDGELDQEAYDAPMEVYETADDGPYTEPGEIEEDLELHDDVDGEFRKRPSDSDVDDHVHTKRRTDSHEQSQIVIELSDDDGDDDDEDEDGEVRSPEDGLTLQRQLSASSAAREQGGQEAHQARLDALAAHEENIKLYKQKIYALEAKKRAKKAISSNATPTPSSTPAQAFPLARVPEATPSTAPSLALAAAGEKVQAQQDSFVAAKSALIERLEKEEAKATAGESTPRKNERQQRIEILSGSITQLDVEIKQAEAEKQRIQAEIERGIQGRLKFSKELQELLAEMEAEDNATKSMTDNPETPAAQLPIVSAEDLEDAFETQEDLDDGGDEIMDISEDEEGEISEDDSPEDGIANQPEVEEAEADEYESFEPHPDDTEEVESSQDESPKDSPLAENEGRAYSPQLEDPTPASDDEVMEYEPDYEPEQAPDSVPDAEAEVDMEQSSEEDPDVEHDENQAQAQPSPRELDVTGPHYTDDQDEADDHPAGIEALLPDATMGNIADDHSTTMDSGSEEGEMVEDDDDDNDEDSDVRQPTSGSTLNNNEEGGEELVAEDNSPDNIKPDGDSEEILMDESSDSESLPNEGSKTTGYTAYESPLQMFKSYRFHPKYATQVPGGFKSLTFSHRIDPNEPLCHRELQGGICADTTCKAQHFRDMNLTDDKLILELGSLNEGGNEEERSKYVSGLKKLLTDLRERGCGLDANLVAHELANYRTRFWGDPSRILTRIGTGL